MWRGTLGAVWPLLLAVCLAAPVPCHSSDTAISPVPPPILLGVSATLEAQARALQGLGTGLESMSALHMLTAFLAPDADIDATTLAELVTATRLAVGEPASLGSAASPGAAAAAAAAGLGGVVAAPVRVTLPDGVVAQYRWQLSLYPCAFTAIGPLRDRQGPPSPDLPPPATYCWLTDRIDGVDPDLRRRERPERAVGQTTACADGGGGGARQRAGPEDVIQAQFKDILGNNTEGAYCAMSASFRALTPLEEFQAEVAEGLFGQNTAVPALSLFITQGTASSVSATYAVLVRMVDGSERHLVWTLETGGDPGEQPSRRHAPWTVAGIVATDQPLQRHHGLEAWQVTLLLVVVVLFLAGVLGVGILRRRRRRQVATLKELGAGDTFTPIELNLSAAQTMSEPVAASTPFPVSLTPRKALRICAQKGLSPVRDSLSPSPWQGSTPATPSATGDEAYGMGHEGDSGLDVSNVSTTSFDLPRPNAASGHPDLSRPSPMPGAFAAEDEAGDDAHGSFDDSFEGGF